ncbi:hypothetical protein ACFVKB_37670 [Rhodococcus sp. NPDC127530]|uniref:hypothetical protein n=1 Tax=unclassified Rhodococcus (in: high G+C Gram-positive bacteria) TaxID=192944 RepID=UPI0036302793
MALIPMRLGPDMTLESLIIKHSSPPGLLDLHAVSGVTQETEEPAIVVLTEIPTTKRLARSKQQQEADDVRAFLSACIPAAEVGAVYPGPHKNDPPDCYAHVGDRRYAIETAQLTLPSQNGKPNSVGRWKLFEQLKEQLFRESGRLKSRLRQHRGYMVTVWFNLDGENRLPPRARRIDEMIDHLKSARPPGPEFFDPSRDRGGLPETVPANTAMNQTDGNTVGCTWAVLPPGFQTGLQRAIGFDIALAYHETYTRSALRAELRRVIEQHDDARSDILVLTVGANTREGVYFPSTGLFADALFADPLPLDGWAPSHLSAVVVHDAEGDRVRWLHGEGLFV